jgi:proteasome lid subunit RPN8/RPN11
VSDRVILGLREALERGIYEHCFSDTGREVGGVLVGRFQPRAAPIVEGSIPALKAQGDATELTFTHDAWEQIHSTLERDFPGRQIVGWYHTHPRAGVFLSPHDLFIHQNFFSNAGQIALVIDPVRGEEAVFCWFTGRKIMEYTRGSCAHRGNGSQSGTRGNPAGRPGEDAPLIARLSGPRQLRPARRGQFPTTLASAIYLLVIGVSIGVVIYELLLR